VAPDDSDALSLVDDGDAVDVISRALDAWVIRVEPLPTGLELPATGWARVAAAQGVAAGLFAAMPELRRACDRFSGGFRVVFSAEARRGLANGSLRLMGNATLPAAVDQAGRIVELARVPSVAVGTGAGVTAGATLMAAWPVALAAGVATAAAWAEQRWLERTFSGLDERLCRIEARLRDDDLGVLTAADLLVDLVADDAMVGAVGEQLRSELAWTRREVERIYFSRRRFVERLKAALETGQTAHEAKTGERRAWAGDAVELLGADATDEIVVFLRAMLCRARLATCTAALLAADGSSQLAVRLLDANDEQMRPDYWDLQNRLRALARSTPESQPLWRQVFDRDDPELALARAKSLDSALRSSVGERLPERDEPLVLDVVAPFA
jgi:hypothetical protein